MLRTLLESGSSSPRRAGGTLFSVGVHTTLIGAAIVATGRAIPGPVSEPPRQHDVVYAVPPAPPSHVQRHDIVENWGHRVPARITLVAPLKIPTTIPPADFRASVTNEHDFDGVRMSLAEAGPWSGRPDEASGAVFTAPAVERPAAPRADNPAPAYPVSLRSASLEGIVVARFVVDTTGRAEPESITFTAATHPLFAEAVREALLRSRYLPALIRNRPVRQLVEQRFAFTLTR